jgi:cytochrome c5
LLEQAIERDPDYGHALASAAYCHQMLAASPNLGQVPTPQQITAWDTNIGPDGAGLPPGHGTAAEGEPVYNEFCLGCHGEKSAGIPNDRLAGGQGTLVGDQPPVKTVGSY